jgi:hypothetical protein
MADDGYQGPQFQEALQVNIEIVKRSDTARAFTVLTKTLDCGANHWLAQPVPQTS